MPWAIRNNDYHAYRCDRGERCKCRPTPEHMRWLKFVTDDFPDGLWSGESQRKKFDTHEEAKKTLDGIWEYETKTPSSKSSTWLESLEVVEI